MAREKLSELKLLMGQHIKTNSNIVEHLSIMGDDAVRFNSFVGHIMGSVHMFPPSPSNRESLFYKTLYQMVEDIAAVVLHEAIEERRNARNNSYYDRVRLVDGKPMTLYRMEGPI